MMNHRSLTHDDGIYSANIRAEDGLQSPSGWLALRDIVVIPTGLFLVLFLLIVLVLFIKDTALAHTGAARAAGWMQQTRTLAVREIG
jgi:hypothetical protein